MSKEKLIKERMKLQQAVNQAKCVLALANVDLIKFDLQNFELGGDEPTAQGD